MCLCAERGLRDWHNACEASRTMAWNCLSGRIVEKSHEVDHVISEKLDPIKELYIPMPVPPNMSKRRKSKHRGFDRCFFLPENANGMLIKLILVLLIPVVHGRSSDGDSRGNFDGKCLAFRFEIAHGSDTTHGYSHVQLTKRTTHYALPCVPGWLPDSYPAVPVRARDPLELFLSMMTAVYGFPHGVDALIKSIFQEHSRATEVDPYWRRLESMLDYESGKESFQAR